jgi:predicted dehydrogenase
MINAAICGLGRWGQALVTAVQGKSDRIRFVRGVVRDPAHARDFASRHGLDLTKRWQRQRAILRSTQFFLLRPTLSMWSK